MGLYLAVIGLGVFGAGFLVAAGSIVRNFFSDSGDVSLKGFGVGFIICIPGVLLFVAGLIIGGAEVLTKLGLL